MAQRQASHGKVEWNPTFRCLEGSNSKGSPKPSSCKAEPKASTVSKRPQSPSAAPVLRGTLQPWVPLSRPQAVTTQRILFAHVARLAPRGKSRPSSCPPPHGTQAKLLQRQGCIQPGRPTDTLACRCTGASAPAGPWARLCSISAEAPGPLQWEGWFRGGWKGAAEPLAAVHPRQPAPQNL